MIRNAQASVVIHLWSELQTPENTVYLKREGRDDFFGQNQIPLIISTHLAARSVISKGWPKKAFDWSTALQSNLFLRSHCFIDATSRACQQSVLMSIILIPMRNNFVQFGSERYEYINVPTMFTCLLSRWWHLSRHPAQPQLTPMNAIKSFFRSKSLPKEFTNDSSHLCNACLDSVQQQQQQQHQNLLSTFPNVKYILSSDSI